MQPCRICDNIEGNAVFEAREMMLGLRDTFSYLQCGRCGCLQLVNPPVDWSIYYPQSYYAFSRAREGKMKSFLKRLRARHALGAGSLTGKLLVRAFGPPPFVRWIQPARVNWSDAILDVGSGGGQLLLDMHNAGFTNLTGVDPYILGDHRLADGTRVLKRHLHEVRGPFDFVMMNHSFEHIDEPEKALLEVARLLPGGKILLIRIPVAGKFAWREYGTDWVQLDAPRHMFLHTEESLRLVANRAGFSVVDVRYDSTGFQFWGSEQYRRSIPLRDERSYSVNPRRSIFTKKQLLSFERAASELNDRGDGDQACFYLILN